MSDRSPAANPIDSLLALARGMWLTLKHLLVRPDDTVSYPFEYKTPPPRLHGRHILNRYEDGLEKCIGCELCAGACPADAILVWGAENPPEAPVSPGERYAAVYQINMLRCIFCGLCVEACPTDAITMTSFFDFTGTSRSSLVYSKEELLEPPPGPERRKFGYTRDPVVLPQDQMEQPGVGRLHRGEGEAGPAGPSEVPVVWLPTETWRGSYPVESTRPGGAEGPSAGATGGAGGPSAGGAGGPSAGGAGGPRSEAEPLRGAQQPPEEEARS